MPVSGVRRPELVRLRAGDPTLSPVFVCHDATGDVLAMVRLSRLLPGQRPVYGIRARVTPEGLPADTTVTEIAATVVEVARSVQPVGALTLLGYSFGSIVAFEAARLLERSGQAVRGVFLLDPYVGVDCLRPVARWCYLWISRPFAVARWLQHADRPTRSRFVRRFLHRFAPWTGVGAVPSDAPPRSEVTERLAATAVTALDDYRPGRLASPVTIVNCHDRFPDMCDPLPVLRRVVDPRHLEIVQVAGTHAEMVQEPYVGDLARLLGERLG